MDNFVYLVCEDDDILLAAVATEADAEELFMDLVMEWQYDRAMGRLHFDGYSVAEINECEWIWESNGPYYITRAPKLY
jgi:hypothetical protein